MAVGRRAGWVLLFGLGACLTPEARLQWRIRQLKPGFQPTGLSAPAARSGCRVTSYNDQVCCEQVQEDLKGPETLDGLRAMLHDEDAGKHRRVKVVGALHSGNRIVCTDGIAITTENLTDVMRLERRDGVQTVVVDAGVQVGDLGQWLYEQGWSLGFTVLGFRGVTVGGAVGTATHGSSLRHPSIFPSRLEGLWVLGPDGTDALQPGQPPVEHKRSSTPDEIFRALAGNLGVLGAVARVRLRVERRFDLQVEATYDDEKVLLRDGPRPLIANCDYGQIVWFPRAGSIMTMCGQKTTQPSRGSAQSVLLDPRATPLEIQLFKELMEDTIENGAPSCTIETERYWRYKSHPPLETVCNCCTQETSKAVGPGYRMMSSDLTGLRAEVPEIDFELAIPMAKAKDALTWVNQFADDQRLCLPLIGLFLRFSPKDGSSLLGHGSAHDDPDGVMFVEFVVFVREKHKPDPNDASYYGRYWQLARELVDRFDGRLHWGKNAQDLFEYQKDHSPAFKLRLDAFRKVADQLDPSGRFANDFSKRVGLTTH